MSTDEVKRRDTLFGSVYQRGGSFVASFRDSNGKRHRKACPTKAAAEALVAKAKMSGFEGRFFQVEKAEVILFDEAANAYLEWAQKPGNKKSWKMDRIHLARFCAAWGGKQLGSITAAMIETYRGARRLDTKRNGTKPVSENTINHELQVLRGLFNWAMKAGKLPKSFWNPVKDVKMTKIDPVGKSRYLTPEEIERLIAACADPTGGQRTHLLPIVVMALNTGMRRGELLKMRWSDVDTKAGVINVRAENAKTGMSRTIPINEPCRKALEACMTLDRMAREGAGDPYVFARPSGEPFVDVKRAFVAACRRASVQNFRFHDLRHTFASYLAMRGVPILEIARLLGHTTTFMTMRYAKLSVDALRQGVTGLYDEGKVYGALMGGRGA